MKETMQGLMTNGMMVMIFWIRFEGDIFRAGLYGMKVKWGRGRGRETRGGWKRGWA